MFPMTVLALAATVSTANIPQNPTWLSDYDQAQARVAALHKPMAVFVASGKEGWSKVVRDGKLDVDATKLLAEKYVCLYVDTKTTAGSALASSFDVSNSGLIISDRDGSTQAYNREGTLTQSELIQTLKKYADPSKEVQTTESVGRTTYSPYGQQYQTGRRQYSRQQYYRPQYYPQPAIRSGGT